MKFLFVGGPEHGRIKEASPVGGMWIVNHIPPLSISRSFAYMGTDSFIEQSTYHVKEILFFEEKLTFLSIDGREDYNRVLDAIIRPEVRDLMYRL